MDDKKIEMIPQNEVLEPITEREIMQVEELKKVDWKKLLNYLEEEKEAFKKVRIIAIGYTRETDWVNIDGVPYLMESGAQAIAGPFGVSFGEPQSEKIWEEDNKGKYYIIIYRAPCFSTRINRRIWAEGMCSSRDKFFGKVGGEYKPLEDIDERNIRYKAMTNMMANGIKRLLGLRNIQWKELLAAGLDIQKIAKVEHKVSGKQTGVADKAIQEVIKESKKEIKQEKERSDEEERNLVSELITRMVQCENIEELARVWEEDKPKRAKLKKEYFDQIVKEKDKLKEFLRNKQEEKGEE